MRTLLFALAALALVGCNGLRPVGPFAKPVPITQQGKPLPGAPAESAAKAPASRPTPPTMYVTPDEVSADNPYAAAGKLSSELSADSKVSPSAPVTVEVSRVKGGIR